jgi:hypothetical protein
MLRQVATFHSHPHHHLGVPELQLAAAAAAAAVWQEVLHYARWRDLHLLLQISTHLRVQEMQQQEQIQGRGTYAVAAAIASLPSRVQLQTAH